MLSTGRQVKGIKAAGTALLRRFLASAPELGEALCKLDSLSARGITMRPRRSKSALTLWKFCSTSVIHSRLPLLSPRRFSKLQRLLQHCPALSVHLWLQDRQGDSICSKHVNIALLAEHLQAHLCSIVCFCVPWFLKVLEDKAAVAHFQL